MSGKWSYKYKNEIHSLLSTKKGIVVVLLGIPWTFLGQCLEYT